MFRIARGFFGYVLVLVGVTVCGAGAFTTIGCERSDGSAVAFYNSGIDYFHQGQFDQAIAEYSKALEINPRYANAYIYRGAAYDIKGQYDQAIANINLIANWYQTSESGSSVHSFLEFPLTLN